MAQSAGASSSCPSGQGRSPHSATIPIAPFCLTPNLSPSIIRPAQTLQTQLFPLNLLQMISERLGLLRREPSLSLGRSRQVHLVACPLLGIPDSGLGLTWVQIPAHYLTAGDTMNGAVSPKSRPLIWMIPASHPGRAGSPTCSTALSTAPGREGALERRCWSQKAF